MSENPFFEFEPLPEEIGRKAVEAKRKLNEVVKSISVVANPHTGMVQFDVEENKKKIIANLEWLTSLSVEEFTFRKKWEEIKESDFFSDATGIAKARIWSPVDINDEALTIKEIENLRPKMVVANTDELEKLWATLRVCCSTAEYNQAPGRFIRFLLVDEVTDKILGISSIASDVISISDRDKFLGWSQDDKLVQKMLKHSAIGTTIVPTQPFGSNFLGGKLTAVMVVSGVVRNEWETQEKGISKRCKLVGMTTTSLYGRPSMYDGLKWWKGVGLSKGKIPIKSSEETYKEWHDYLKVVQKKAYEEAMTQKEGVSGPVTGAKMRVLALIFKEIGIKQSDYVHGFERGVYYSCFYENTKEFLSRKINEDKLVLKPLFKEDTNAILDWWRPKAIERYKKLKAENRLNPNKLFYEEMKRMTYEEAKTKFFNAVGR